MLETAVVRAAEQDGDDVEAAGDFAQGVLEEVALGDPPDLALLPRGDGFLGPPVGFVGPGLDLYEDERAAVAGDDVDLAAEQPEAPLDDLVALFAEMLAGDAPRRSGPAPGSCSGRGEGA